ncbi:helix-turn-helix transcriptional regulator [Streptococcus ferus]|uniref:helix-turn-helix domain-containing protein n=1 Tax=Streptococcus ferus TaxID=1345 RepID=UPI0035144046
MNLKIRQLRAEKGIEIHQLAKQADISVQSIRNWESGKAYPTVASVEKLAAVLNVSPAYLVGWDKAKTMYYDPSNTIIKWKSPRKKWI